MTAVSSLVACKPRYSLICTRPVLDRGIMTLKWCGSLVAGTPKPRVGRVEPGCQVPSSSPMLLACRLRSCHALTVPGPRRQGVARFLRSSRTLGLETRVELDAVGNRNGHRRLILLQYLPKAVDHAFDHRGRDLSFLETNGDRVLAFTDLDTHSLEARARLVAEAVNHAVHAVGSVQRDPFGLKPGRLGVDDLHRLVAAGRDLEVGRLVGFARAGVDQKARAWDPISNALSLALPSFGLEPSNV